MSRSSATICAGARNPGSVVIRRGGWTGGGYSLVTWVDASYGRVICGELAAARSADARNRGGSVDGDGACGSGTATWVLRGSKPVAITVIRTSSVTLGSITEPKMMLASSCAACWINDDASLTSC